MATDAGVPAYSDELGDTDLKALLDLKLCDLSVLHSAHWKAAKKYSLLARALGVSVVIVTAVIGTGIYATAEGASNGWRIFAGFLALLAAVLAAAQTSLAYDVLAANHKEAAAKWGKLRRCAELLSADPPHARDDLHAAIQLLLEEWDETVAASPSIPHRTFERAKKRVFQKGETARVCGAAKKRWLDRYVGGSPSPGP